MTEYTDEELQKAIKGKYVNEFDRPYYQLEYVVGKYRMIPNSYHRYECVGSQEFLNSDYDSMEKAYQDCIKEIFEDGTYKEYQIRVCKQEAHETIKFDYSRLESERDRIESQRRFEEEKQAKIDRWNDAIEWARKNGANIRHGKVTKDLCKYRIYSAGLMERFSKEYPEFAFNLNDVMISVERLKERDAAYAEKKAYSEKKKIDKAIEDSLKDKYNLLPEDQE